tara:strand:- start:333 stop:593 length:261 start_codon:yes stop_codon:yes gene_type:complete
LTRAKLCQNIQALALWKVQNVDEDPMFGQFIAVAAVNIDYLNWASKWHTLCQMQLAVHCSDRTSDNVAGVAVAGAPKCVSSRILAS